MRDCELVTVNGTPVTRGGRVYWKSYDVISYGPRAEMIDAYANLGGHRDKSLRLLVDGEFLGLDEVTRLANEVD